MGGNGSAETAFLATKTCSRMFLFAGDVLAEHLSADRQNSNRKAPLDSGYIRFKKGSSFVVLGKRLCLRCIPKHDDS